VTQLQNDPRIVFLAKDLMVPSYSSLLLSLLPQLTTSWPGLFRKPNYCLFFWAATEPVTQPCGAAFFRLRAQTKQVTWKLNFIRKNSLVRAIT
jgi:hypothetical protein